MLPTMEFNDTNQWFRGFQKQDGTRKTHRPLQQISQFDPTHLNPSCSNEHYTVKILVYIWRESNPKKKTKRIKTHRSLHQKEPIKLIVAVLIDMRTTNIFIFRFVKRELKPKDAKIAYLFWAASAALARASCDSRRSSSSRCAFDESRHEQSPPISIPRKP